MNPDSGYMPILAASSSGYEGLFWLLVVAASIIAQLLKARKKGGGAAGPEPSAGEQGAPAAPGDEFRRFLETLSGAGPARPAPGSAPTPAPASQPMPKVKRQAAVAKPGAWDKRGPRATVRTSMRHVVRPSTVTSTSGTGSRKAAAVVKERALAAEAAFAAAAPAPALASLAAALRAALVSKSAARHLVVLREVFSPPMALRHGRLTSGGVEW